MTAISERPFNTTQSDSTPASPAWTTDDGPLSGFPGYFQSAIFADATAPKSPSNCLRFTYPTGFAGGGAPGHAGLAHTAFANIYHCFAAKFSTNWVGHPSSVNKMVIEWTTSPNNPSCVFSGSGVGSATLVPQLRLQNIVTFPAGGGNQNPNIVPTAAIIRGQWHVHEIYIQPNTAGAANGSVDWYLDGVHISSVIGIGWTTAATTFNTFEIQPIWGGTGGSITADQTMDWDHVYLSGK